MMPALLLLLALSAPNDAPSLTALSDGVARCDRAATMTVFQAEESRRTRFMTDAYIEQEAIVQERRALTTRRQLLRTATVQTADSEAAVALAAALNADRQAALDDARLLERLRRETIDQMRRQFLSTCGDGRRRAGTPPVNPAPTAENAP
ncbi:MAG: hypothetical protein ABL909_10930 [Sphingopyxis sp.]